MVGHEKMDDKQVAENLFAVYTQLLSSLPNGKQNIKNVSLKLTMGAPSKLEV
jgi:ribosomal protein L1